MRARQCDELAAAQRPGCFPRPMPLPPPPPCPRRVLTASLPRPSPHLYPNLQVGWQVYEGHAEARRIKAQYDAEVRAADSAEEDSKKQQRLLSTLKDQVELQQKALVTIDSSLDAARSKVAQLESQRAAAVKDAAEAAAGMGCARSKIGALAAEVKRRRENATVSLMYCTSYIDAQLLWCQVLLQRGFVRVLTHAAAHTGALAAVGKARSGGGQEPQPGDGRAAQPAQSPTSEELQGEVTRQPGRVRAEADGRRERPAPPPRPTLPCSCNSTNINSVEISY